ncbi:MAG: hypothetical protein AAGJ81_11715 [Verrucomicrobiota bacterium]
MKFLFPIFRFNWYRTVAPIIDEVLSRGNEVVCLHNESTSNFSSNRPDESLLPKWANGSPSYDSYHSEQELWEKVSRTDADIVVSIDLPLDEWIDREEWKRRKFLYLTVATTDTLRRLWGPNMLAATDFISVRSEWERDACILDHTVDYCPWIRRCDEMGIDGNRYRPLMEPRLGKEWPESMIEDFLCKTLVAGYPLLDGVSLIDRDEVFRRRRLNPEKPVIGLWSTPTLGRGYYGTWDRIFAQRDQVRFRYRALRGYGLRGLTIPYCNEETVLRSIRDFVDHNNAQLVVKLRHYQGPEESLFTRFADGVVTEDNYYPHSALELACIADLMIGFHTAGMPEAVFAGAPVLNLTIPGFDTEIHAKTMHFFDGMFESKGVVTRMGSVEAARNLDSFRLDEFRFEEEAREDYLMKFAGPRRNTDLSFSANLMEQLESRLAAETG